MRIKPSIATSMAFPAGWGFIHTVKVSAPSGVDVIDYKKMSVAEGIAVDLRANELLLVNGFDFRTFDVEAWADEGVLTLKITEVLEPVVLIDVYADYPEDIRNHVRNIREIIKYVASVKLHSDVAGKGLMTEDRVQAPAPAPSPSLVVRARDTLAALDRRNQERGHA